MNILVALDLSDATEKVLQTVTRVAQSTDAEVWLLHVAEPDPDFVGYAAGPEVVREQVAKEFRDQHRAVQTQADALRDRGVKATALLIQGPTVETILKEAERLSADLIIVGSHGHGALYDLVAGSISLGVLKKADTPVLVVPTR